MAHIIIGESTMGAAICVAGVKLNLMRDDPSEALFMLRPLVSCLSFRVHVNIFTISLQSRYSYKVKRFNSRSGRVLVADGI